MPLGATERVRSLRPHPLRGMRLTSPDGTSFVGEYGRDREPGFALRRLDLDQALLDTARARGVEVVEEARATDVRIEGGAVTALSISRSGGPETTCETRLVVGADGRGSVVARRLGLLREHRRLRKFAVRGHFEGMEGLSDYGEMHVGGGGYCGIAPLSRSTANVAFVLDRREMRSRGRRRGDVLSATPCAAGLGSPSASRGRASWAPHGPSDRSPSKRTASPPPGPCSWATPPGSTTPSPARA